MKKRKERSKVLVGNSFPFSLVRCERLVVEAETIPKMQDALKDVDIESFWGHANTRAAAESVLGVSLAPKTDRPALSLSENKFPMLNGETFDTCWLLSPDYPEGFRPAIGQEVALDMISGWHVLKLTWKGNE